MTCVKCGGKIIDIYFKNEKGHTEYDYSVCELCMKVVITDGPVEHLSD